MLKLALSATLAVGLTICTTAQVSIEYSDCSSIETKLNRLNNNPIISCYLEKEVMSGVWRKIQVSNSRDENYDSFFNLPPGNYRVSYVKNTNLHSGTKLSNESNKRRDYTHDANVFISRSIIIPCAESISNNHQFSNTPSLRVYPNPTNSKLYIVGKENLGVVSYKLTTIKGVRISQSQLKKGEFIDVSTLPPGIYFIELSNKEENIYHVEAIYIN